MIEKLKLIFPSALPGWIEALESQMAPAGIDTPNEIASFCSQLHVESRGLTMMEESLYYTTPQRLCEIWPHRFALPDSHGIVPEGKRSPYPYVRNPEALANYVYADANRAPQFALGNTDVGDGFKYRGMGPPQITGKNNYRKCGEAIGFDLVKTPQLLKQPIPGVKSAIWYWRSHGLDAVDDDLDVRAETRIVTGGTTGFVARQKVMDDAVKILNGV